MRISDWSSDVCSSDLACDSNDARSWRRFHHQHQFGRIADRRSLRSSLCIIKIGDQYAHEICRHTIWEDQYSLQCGLAWAHPHSDSARQRSTRSVRYLRSEEHTSELQSLMRISYAVFCLKKKNNTNNKTAKIVNTN